MKLFDFRREYGDKETIVNKLRSIGLLNGNIKCDKCGDTMIDRQYKNTDGIRVHCDKRSCRTKKSARDRSFFSGAKLSLNDAMLFMHLWSKGYSEKLILEDFEFSNKTVIDWSRFFRDLCIFEFENSDAIIGGPGSIVEIDETIAIKRKHEVGRMPSTAGWLFGGIERREDGVFNCFIKLVFNRSEGHLTHLIQQHVRQGTHIITDGWAAYRNLGSMGYIHNVVIHETNFVSPEDVNIHTQLIESTWSSLKRFLRTRGTNKGEYYLEYICEWLFRRKYNNVFDGIINTIRNKYQFG